MTYSIITPADNADFFAQFKTFVVSAGWTIDAQSDTELYIHNGSGKYLGFRLAPVTFYSYIGETTGTTKTFFTCVENSGYDSTKDYFNQPDSSLANIDASTLPSYGSYTYTEILPCLFCINITQAVFVSNGTDLIVSVKNDTYSYHTLIVSSIFKSHTFSGGDLISCSLTLRYYNAKWYLYFATNALYSKSIALPFQFSFTIGLNADGGSYATTLFQVGTTFLCANGGTKKFLTNIVWSSSRAADIALVPFAPYNRITNLGVSMYSGLFPLYAAEFFYLSGSTYRYAGYVDKIKLIRNASGLTHGQILQYGVKEYLILEFSRGDVVTTTTDYVCSEKIAVEL